MIITAEKAGKRFNREWIFRNFNYSFSKGTVYAITGPNGSGKSTLLQVLWGQLPSTQGTVQYLENNTQLSADQWFSRLAIAAPYMDLIEEFTLTEMVNFHFKFKTARTPASTAELIARMQLSKAAGKPLRSFSSGMRQRVKLALALYTNADVLFLDEPGTNLDQRALEWYQKELEQIAPYTLTFVASNQTQEFPATAEKLSILDFK